MISARPARTAIFMCEHCRALFRARIADRKRGWAKCCSKPCAAANKAHRRVPLPTVGPEFQFTDPRTANMPDQPHITDLDLRLYFRDADPLLARELSGPLEVTLLEVERHLTNAPETAIKLTILVNPMFPERPKQSIGTANRREPPMRAD